ncbi:MAG: hypothetical protein FWE80_02785, partial [Oscillospiraceae bacterium]|nr:hypothetical protein [Oscillospiraceae bacterium]
TGDYTVIRNITGNTAAVSDIKLDNLVTYRYIKLDVIKGTQETDPDSTNNPRARIGQFEIYNTKTQTWPDEGGTSPTITGFNEKMYLVDARIETTLTMGGLPLTMNTWLAAGDNLLVTEIKSGAGSPLPLTASVWAQRGGSDTPIDVTLSPVPTVSRTTRTTSNVNGHRSQAALATKIIGAEVTDMTPTPSVSASADIFFTMAPDSTVYIVTAIGGGGRTHNRTGMTLLDGVVNPKVEAANMLDEVEDTDAVSALRDGHDGWWKDYWLTSYIELDQSVNDLKTIQQYYYAAQYLFGCMANEDGIAPGLYGIWHTQDARGWNSDYHLNYNYIATWYGAFSSNRPELAKSAIQMLLDYVPVAKKAAGTTSELRKLQNFGSGSHAADRAQLTAIVRNMIDNKIDQGLINATSGIADAVIYPVGIGPYGMELDPAYHGQMANGAFNATIMLDYYEATLDDDFLQADLYDFLKMVATFYEAWLVDEGDGSYTLYAGYNEGSWAKNSAVELAMCKRVLKNVIQFSEKLELDADRREKWQDMLDGLAPPPTAVYNGKTIYSLAQEEYWCGDNNGNHAATTMQWMPMSRPVPGDGNFLTMESVFPGRMLGYYSTPAELQLARDTTDVYAQNGVWNQNNSFPKVYPVAVNIRYPIQTIITNFASRIRSQTVANLMIYDGIHGAEKVGATAAVNSMLLLSHNGIIKMFGNWLPNRNASFTRLRADGAFIVSASYDGTAQKPVSGAAILSEKGGSCTVANLWDDMYVVDQDGNPVDTVPGTAPNHPDEKTTTFQTQPGKTYKLLSESAPPETDKTALQDLVISLKDINYSSYTPLSAQPVFLAGEAAADILAKPNATQTEVDDAAAALSAAIEALRKWGFVDTKAGKDKVAIDDARLILQYLVDKIDLDPASLAAAAVQGTVENGEPKVTISDARLVLQYLVGKINKFPLEE